MNENDVFNEKQNIPNGSNGTKIFYKTCIFAVHLHFHLLFIFVYL